MSDTPPREQPPRASASAADAASLRPSAPLHRHQAEPRPTGKRLAILSVAAIGVVYGDIGTSPLYALKACFDPSYGITPTRENVYGVLSLILWSLTLVVAVKYIVFIMRADNRGEGGVLALLALVLQRGARGERRAPKRTILVILGLVGCALLYGDGVITPALSVLGAMEGLHVASPAFDRVVVPATVLILFALFMLQRFGIGRAGRVFGPVMLLWFASIAALGVAEIAREPAMLLAVNPLYAVDFFTRHGVQAFLLLGAVVLVITGVEALYADMGHFGRRPIRLAWFALVFPALLLNYFGQGALLLRDPTAAANPFYLLVPAPLLYPMVVLATTAAIVASQALISGAFSLSQQAVQLGYSPRMTITHTSEEEAGQIYVSEVNKALMWGCIFVVLFFRSATAMTGAYGIAVTGTMAVTTMLFFSTVRRRQGWSAQRAVLFLVFFLTVDLAFLGANAMKFDNGGWFPVAVGAVLFVAMTTWKRGREMLRSIQRRGGLPLDLFLADVARRRILRVPGTAVFMTSEPVGTPVVLLHHVKHNKMLHAKVVLLSVMSADVPEVTAPERVDVTPLGEEFYRVIARYGFMETPNVPDIMRCCEQMGFAFPERDTTYYLGRERIIAVKRKRAPATAETPTADRASTPTPGSVDPVDVPIERLAFWRRRLFAVMARNARSATEYFGIPPNRVVELGAQIEL